MRLISGLQLEIKLDLRSSILMDLSSQVCGVTSASAGETEGVDLDSETGEPTGVLRENAVKLLQKLMSEEDSRAAKKDQLITCLGKLGSVGVVGVQGGDSVPLYIWIRQLFGLFWSLFTCSGAVRSTGAFIRCLHEILVEEVWYIYKFVPTKCNIWCPRSHFLVLPYINGILEGRCILILSRQSERFGAPAPTSWFISLFWEKEDRCILLLSQRSVKLGTPVPTLWFTCLLSSEQEGVEAHFGAPAPFCIG